MYVKKKRRYRRRLVIVVGVAMLTTNCAHTPSEDDAFVRAFVAAPDRMEAIPADIDTRALLEQFKPRIYIAPDSYCPIDFYRDYLPYCVVRNRNGDVVTARIDRVGLKAIAHDPQYYLDFQIEAALAKPARPGVITPTIYGRMYQDVLIDGDQRYPLRFLKYSLVFPYSGLPARLPAWKRLGSHAVGDPTARHELDIHGAIHIVLSPKNNRLIGVLLAQHNHHRLYLADRDFDRPSDNRVLISIAQYSNEPYLITDAAEARWERTVGNPLDLAYRLGRSAKAPPNSGFDHVLTPTSGAEEVAVTLALLPADDPLYTAWTNLGDRRKFGGFYEQWYTAGPPGIDFYTVPELKNLADLMAMADVDASDDRFFTLFERDVHSFSNYDLSAVLPYQRTRLRQSLHHLRAIPRW